MKKEDKKRGYWWWFLLILIALYIYANYRDKWEEENCDLTFYTHTYSDSCASACSIKCSDEGFHSASSSYFEPSLIYEEMIDSELYKRCECNCGGCRE